jgi:hypothetical protein
MPRESLERLSAFVANADTVNVLMAADEETGDGEISFEVQRFDMSRSLAERFRDIDQSDVTDDVEENRLVPYTTGYKLDRQELFYVDLDEAEALAETLDFIESVTEPEVFTKSEDFADRMALYSIVVEDADGAKAAFYRKHAPKNQLSRGVLAQLVDQQHFQELEPRVYLFDEQIDFFSWDGHLFIEGAYNFRLIFDHFERVREEAEQNARQVTDVVPILNDDEFVEACKDQPQMVSKVARVAQKPYLEDVEMDDIRRTIDEFDLDINIVEVNGEEELLFDPSVETRWIILKMLDDDYLGSVMTDRKYEANSKRSMGG